MAQLSFVEVTFFRHATQLKVLLGFAAESRLTGRAPPLLPVMQSLDSFGLEETGLTAKKAGLVLLLITIRLQPAAWTVDS